MHAITFTFSLGVVYLLLIPALEAQTTVESQASSASVTIVGVGSSNYPIASPAVIFSYQQQQSALAESYSTLMASNPTLQQIQAWQQQNSSAIQQQSQQAQTMGAASNSQPMATINLVNVPANASQTVKDFLVEQVTLANSQANIHNQLLQQNAGVGQTAPQASGGQQERQMALTFQQLNAAGLQAQGLRAQSLATTSFLAAPLPSKLVVPANTPPQVAALLQAKYQLMLSQIQVLNQNANATPSAQALALRQWQEQNAAALAQFRQSAQNLSAGNVAPQD